MNTGRIAAVAGRLLAGDTAAQLRAWVREQSGWQPIPSDRTIRRLAAAASAQIRERLRVDIDLERARAAAEIEALQRAATDAREYRAALACRLARNELMGLTAPAPAGDGADAVTVDLSGEAGACSPDSNVVPISAASSPMARAARS